MAQSNKLFITMISTNNVCAGIYSSSFVVDMTYLIDEIQKNGILSCSITADVKTKTIHFHCIMQNTVNGEHFFTQTNKITIYNRNVVFSCRYWDDLKLYYVGKAVLRGLHQYDEYIKAFAQPNYIRLKDSRFLFTFYGFHTLSSFCFCSLLFSSLYFVVLIESIGTGKSNFGCWHTEPKEACRKRRA